MEEKNKSLERDKSLGMYTIPQVCGTTSFAVSLIGYNGQYFII